MELTTIKNSIHEIRGKRVILDYELAKMYEVETRVLKQAVRRNIDRFPEDFMFQLNPEEWENLRFQLKQLNQRSQNATFYQKPRPFSHHRPAGNLPPRRIAQGFMKTLVCFFPLGISVAGIADESAEKSIDFLYWLQVFPDYISTSGRT